MKGKLKEKNGKIYWGIKIKGCNERSDSWKVRRDKGLDKGRYSKFFYFLLRKEINLKE